MSKKIQQIFHAIKNKILVYSLSFVLYWKHDFILVMFRKWMLAYKTADETVGVNKWRKWCPVIRPMCMTGVSVMIILIATTDMTALRAGTCVHDNSF